MLIDIKKKIIILLTITQAIINFLYLITNQSHSNQSMIFFPRKKPFGRSTFVSITLLRVLDLSYINNKKNLLIKCVCFFLSYIFFLQKIKIPWKQQKKYASTMKT